MFHYTTGLALPATFPAVKKHRQIKYQKFSFTKCYQIQIYFNSVFMSSNLHEKLTTCTSYDKILNLIDSSRIMTEQFQMSNH